MRKKLLLILSIVLVSNTIKSQSFSNLVFESTVLPTGDVTLTFDYEGVSAGDTFEWQLMLALEDGSPDWANGRNIAYQTAIVPNETGTGTQTVTLGLYNTPVDGEVFTWTGKITLASDNSDTGYNNTGNLVTISSTAGVNDFVSQDKISIYPNPSSEVLNISNKYLDIKSVQIFSIIGKKVTELKVGKKTLISIDISNLSKGIYLISTGSNRTAKFVKK
jgi:hypothetical protein